ncbi:potassium channel family protein [Altererythrobacter sp. MF3-039]|uniref:potassium channel family protein n=1 Tax=Altererythrobacter sp. MF3-039 TaxID=3252901 RepID=UPI00390C7267
MSSILMPFFQSPAILMVASRELGWHNRNTKEGKSGARELLLTILVTLVAVALCNAVHFFSLRQLAFVFREFPPPIRRPMLVVSFAVIVIHLIEVAIYAVSMWLLSTWERGVLLVPGEPPISSPTEFFYFSIASYTTLGIGDIVPQGDLRVVVGIEALQGLILIAWSASFTYLVMEKFWTRKDAVGLDDG